MKETRVPQPTSPGHPHRVDYEYEQAGTASVFLSTETLKEWRGTSVRLRRTAIDWAHEVQALLNQRYPDADKVLLVCDNLNTHKVASLYEAFPPDDARHLAQRLEIHYTPKHRSWLNVAECELRWCSWAYR